MHILKLDSWLGVEKIEEEKYNLCLLTLKERSIYNHRFAKTLLSNHFEALRVHISPQTSKEEIESYLREKLTKFIMDDSSLLIEADVFYEDISMIATTFLKTLNANSVVIQLESVRENTCKIFHVDHNEYRLLFTYIGKSTEYLLDIDVNRKYLGSNRTHLIKKKNSSIQQVNQDSIAILKGLKKTHNALVHRSPKYDQEPRLLLRIDSNPTR